MMTKSLKRHLLSKCNEEKLNYLKNNLCDKVQSNKTSELENYSIDKKIYNRFYGNNLEEISGMNSRIQETNNSIEVLKIIDSSNCSSKQTNSSETSSRPNSVDEKALSVTSSQNNNTATDSVNLNVFTNHYFTSNPNFNSLSNFNGYTSNSTTTMADSTTYNVNQDFLLRMAIQNNSNVANCTTNNLKKVWHNDSLAVAAAAAAAAAAVANANNSNSTTHSLYQSALAQTNSTTTVPSIVNSSITAHHFAALNSHNATAFQNLHAQQQQHLNSKISHNKTIPKSIQSTPHSLSQLHTSNVINGHCNPSNSNNQPNLLLSSNPVINSDNLLSSIDSSNSSLISVTNGLVNSCTSRIPNLSNGITNGSPHNSNACLNSNLQAISNEQLSSDNNSLFSENTTSPFLASNSTFVPSCFIDASSNNFYTNLKKRKRSPQPIPPDLKDDAYWDRRRRNNESAKRSREMRREKERQTAIKLYFLEQQNIRMATELELVKKEAKKMHKIIYDNNLLRNSL